MKAIHTIVIAIVAMIGMTGLSMAAPTAEYSIDFGGTGSGTIDITTNTGAGDDRMFVKWTNTNVGGFQDVYAASQKYVEIERGVTVGTDGWNQAASGYVSILTNDDAPYGGDRVSVYAAYKDDVAGGSHISVGQHVELRDYGLVESITTNTEIFGFANGADTLVSGKVRIDTDGTNEATITNRVAMTEGELCMNVVAVGIDYQYLETATMDLYNYGDGTGSWYIGATSDILTRSDYMPFIGTYDQIAHVYVFEL